jgi:hypothetical protein
VSISQNAQNARKKTTTFIGVFMDKNMYIKAAIKVNGRKIHLGNFKDPLEAALAYDHAARKAFGSDALTNFRYYSEIVGRLDPNGKEARDFIQRKGKKSFRRNTK